MPAQIGIVGGGFSGLLSAYLLERLLDAEARIAIYESSERLGGRIQTCEFEGFDVFYDAGAAEFYDIIGSPYLRNLVRTLNLPTTPLIATPYFLYKGNVLKSETDFRKEFGDRGFKSIEDFWDTGVSLRPPSAYARAGHPQDNTHPWSDRLFADVLSEIPDPKARDFTAMQVHSDVATEPHLTNGLFGFDNLLIDHPGYCSMYTIDGGNDQLIKALRNNIDARVLLGATVLSIETDRNKRINLTFKESQGTIGRHSLDFVILTLSPTDLDRIDWPDAELRRRVQRHIEHHSYPTDYLRVSVLFGNRFWQEQFPEDYFVSSAFDGVTVYDKSPRDGSGDLGVLSWLIAGAAASRMAGLPDTQVLRDVLESLPNTLPKSEALVLAHRVDHWTDGMGVSRLPGGLPLLDLNERHIPHPRFPNILFAGDYMYDATINGAMDAVVLATTNLVSLIDPPGRASIEATLRVVGTENLELSRITSVGRTTNQLCFMKTQ